MPNNQQKKMYRRLRTKRRKALEASLLSAFLLTSVLITPPGGCKDFSLGPTYRTTCRHADCVAVDSHGKSDTHEMAEVFL